MPEVLTSNFDLAQPSASNCGQPGAQRELRSQARWQWLLPILKHADLMWSTETSCPGIWRF